MLVNSFCSGVVRKGLDRLREAADADLDDVLEFGRTYPWLAELHSFVKSYSPELLTLYVEQPKGKLEVRCQFVVFFLEFGRV